jgi:hypothetical protein
VTPFFFADKSCWNLKTGRSLSKFTQGSGFGFAARLSTHNDKAIFPAWAQKVIPEAIEGLDLALESLYPHTGFALITAPAS